jgi:hypothetical protein
LPSLGKPPTKAGGKKQTHTSAKSEAVLYTKQNKLYSYGGYSESNLHSF